MHNKYNMAKKKRKAKKRRKVKKRAKKKDNKIMQRWLFTAIVVIILFALLFSIPSGNNDLIGQEQTQEAITEITIEYTCKRDSECFLVNCKSTPDIVECVNVIGQDTYYENCEAYWDVNVVRDYTKCSCVDGACK